MGRGIPFWSSRLKGQEKVKPVWMKKILKAAMRFGPGNLPDNRQQGKIDWRVPHSKANAAICSGSRRPRGARSTQIEIPPG
jgi:hypothetical protein